MPSTRKTVSSGVMSSIVAQGQENVARLEASFSDAPLTEVATDYLRPNKANPRRHISERSVDDMVNGIRQANNEIIQPLLIRPISKDPEGYRYEVVCGNRRLLGARRIGLPKVPVRVREMTDEEAARFALWENLAREDLNPMDVAESVDGLRRIDQLSWEQVMDHFGFSRQWCWTQQKLVKLPEPVRSLVSSGELDPSKAMLIGDSGKNDEEMTALAYRIVGKKISYRDLRIELNAERCKDVFTLSSSSTADSESRSPLTFSPPSGKTGRNATRISRTAQELVALLNAGTLTSEFAQAMLPIARRIQDLAANADPKGPPETDQNHEEEEDNIPAE